MDLDTLDDTGFQLVLPSGAKIGHRSLLRLAYVNILWGMKGGGGTTKTFVRCYWANLKNNKI